MAQDQVEIDPQQAANGIAQWNAAAGALKANWNSKLAEIHALHGTQTWGADGPGKAFSEAYTETGGTTFQDTAQPVIDQIVELGPKVKTAVEHSLGADEVQARVMDIDVQGL